MRKRSLKKDFVVDVVVRVVVVVLDAELLSKLNRVKTCKTYAILIVYS